MYPVHPAAAEIEGLPAFRSVSDVPVVRLDRVSVYLPPAVGVAAVGEIAKKPAGEVWLNPGANAPEVVTAAKAAGLNVVLGCSIVDVGLSPRMFPDE